MILICLQLTAVGGGGSRALASVNPDPGPGSSTPALRMTPTSRAASRCHDDNDDVINDQHHSHQQQLQPLLGHVDVTDKRGLITNKDTAVGTTTFL